MHYPFIDYSFAFSTGKEWRLSFSIRHRALTGGGEFVSSEMAEFVSARFYFTRRLVRRNIASPVTHDAGETVRNQRSGERAD